MKTNILKWILLIICVLFLALHTTGCGPVGSNEDHAGTGDQETPDDTPDDEEPKNPKYLSLSLSQISVKSDDSDFSLITATVLDEDNVPVEGVEVKFDVDAGKISAAEVETNEDGEASIQFSSGTIEKKNQVVVITATVSGLEKKSIPVQIAGTEITLDVKNSADLEIGGEDKGSDRDTLTISVKDAGELGIYQAPVSISVSPQNVVTFELASGYSEFKTDVTGTLKIDVIAQTPGEATLTVESLGDIKTQKYKVGGLGEVFSIIDPIPASGQDYVSINTGDLLEITVAAPKAEQQLVTFATSLGLLTGPTGTNQVIQVPVTDQRATIVLSSDRAGVATVQAFDSDDRTTQDTLTVVITAPAVEATQISLQASSSVVATSTADLKNTITLTATVKNQNDQIVGGAAVAFRIINPTGGGESVSPVVSFTNDLGVASSTFTSGSLSTDAEGIEIKAFVLNSATEISSSINITIGGTAGSVFIGDSTQIESINNNTAYRLPMSVMVSDSNGNPVSGATVSLGAWPVMYATGYWYTCIPGPCCAGVTATIENEDNGNRNLILDPGEDDNGDGELTPPNSSAGSLPTTVTTGENGVAEFYLVYLKASAVWIKSEITASTKVLGTETKATYSFWLPFINEESCSLPHSPYNEERVIDQIKLTATPDTLRADGASQAIIRALAIDKDGEVALDYERIKFEIIDGTGGLPYAQTATGYTEDGVASVMYTAGKNPGTVTIRASANNGVSGTMTLSLTEGSLRVSAVPNHLLADGVSQGIITAQVMDGYGNPVTEDEIVSFSIESSLDDPGTFGNSGPTIWGETTDGVTQVPYVAGTSVGTVTIRAELVEKGIVATTTIQLSTSKITIKATPTNMHGDGYSYSLVSATVTGLDGQPVKLLEPVLFEIIPDGGQAVGGLPDANPVWAYTDMGGVASVYYQSGIVSTPTNVTIRAYRFSDGASAELQIALSAPRIEMSAEPTSVVADGTSTSTVFAEVYWLRADDSHDMAQSEEVNFSLSGPGTIDGAKTYSSLTIGGIAYTTYEAAYQSGTAVITGSLPNYNVQDSVQLTVTPQSTTVGSITLVAAPKTSPADGASSVTVTATIKDSRGLPVPRGTQVEFKTTHGTIFNTAVGQWYETATPDDTGVISIPVQAPTSAGVAIITCRVNGSTQAVTVEFTVDESPVPAYLGLSANPVSIKTDNSDSATITALVLDEKNAGIENVQISFTVSAGPNSQLPAAGIAVLSDPTAITDENGLATVTLSSGNVIKDNRVVSVTAVVAGMDENTGVQTVPITVTGTTIVAEDGNRNLQVDGTAAELLLTVRDAGSVPIAGATVRIFSTDSLDPNTVVTDVLSWKPYSAADSEYQSTQTDYTTNVNGQVRLKIRGEKSGNVNIVAQLVNVDGVYHSTTVNYIVETAEKKFGVPEPIMDNLNLLPAANVYYELTQAKIDQLVLENPNLPAAQLASLVDIEYPTQADFVNALNGVLSAAELNDYGEQIITAARTLPANIDPETLFEQVTEKVFSAQTDIPFTISVNVPVMDPSLEKVVFATSLGSWVEATGDPQVLEVERDFENQQIFTATLVSTEAGAATIRIYAVEAGAQPDPDTIYSDTIQILFSAPVSKACKITIQASSTVVAPRVADQVRTVELTATVKTKGDQVVGGAPVLFSLEQTTGGGEYISPVIGITNDYGQINTTFTSGFVSSSASGIEIKAKVVGITCDIDDDGDLDDIEDSVIIVIGGTAGAISIGSSTHVQVNSENTEYILPMTVMVTDSNGNAVNGALVTLKLWPGFYSIGNWCSYWFGSPPRIEYETQHGTYPPAGTKSTFPNEDDFYDINSSYYRNLTLDPKEDGCYASDTAPCPDAHPGEYDGQLWPPIPAAGTAPETVTTDENGLATFDLIYLKKYAIWTMTEITASTKVLGSETRSTMMFWLPYLFADEEVLFSTMNESPYNTEQYERPETCP